jgi:hypothetical protein
MPRCLAMGGSTTALLLSPFTVVALACAAVPAASVHHAEPTAAEQVHAETAADRNLWMIVDASVTKGDGAASVRAFHERIAKLPADEVLRIHRAFDQQLARSYTWELWGAAYVINGGCSDDCFEYFRGWLVMQGQSVFEDALANPESLAAYAYVGQPAELEDALYVTRDVYQAITGERPAGTVLYPKLDPKWDFDESSEMKRRYPKLCAKFGDP